MYAHVGWYNAYGVYLVVSQWTVNQFGCKLYSLCRKHIKDCICLRIVVGECCTPILVCAAEIVAFPWLHGGALCKINYP